ncbi:hypothetical protein IT087_03095 [Candidatus Uhrbacteria bacterium]|nr:hypothetical protein [Candidatus Uhrbacteria bacterium]
MGLIFRVLLGAAIVGGGVAFVIKTRDISDFFGPVPFAEKYLGGGGTTLFYKLLGVVFCLIGFIVMFNLWDAFLQATLGSLLPRT